VLDIVVEAQWPPGCRKVGYDRNFGKDNYRGLIPVPI
jgi:hypothetical protein